MGLNKNNIHQENSQGDSVWLNSLILLLLALNSLIKHYLKSPKFQYYIKYLMIMVGVKEDK